MPSDLSAERLRIISGSDQWTLSTFSGSDPNGVALEPSGSLIRTADGRLWKSTSAAGVWQLGGPDAVSDAYASLQAGVTSSVNTLSGTIDARFINLTGSLISGLAGAYSSLQAGSTASIGAIYTTILAGTSASDGTYYTTLQTGVSASDAAVQTSLRAGVTASLQSYYTTILAGTSASDGTYYTTILAGTSASDGTYYTTLQTGVSASDAAVQVSLKAGSTASLAAQYTMMTAGTSASDAAVQTSLKAGVTASFGSWAGNISAQGALTGTSLLLTSSAGAMSFHDKLNDAGIYDAGSHTYNYMSIDPSTQFNVWAGSGDTSLAVLNSGGGKANLSTTGDFNAGGSITGSSGVKIGGSTSANSELLGQLDVNGTVGGGGFVLGHVGGLPKWTVLSGAGGLSGGGTAGTVPIWASEYALTDSKLIYSAGGLSLTDASINLSLTGTTNIPTGMYITQYGGGTGDPIANDSYGLDLSWGISNGVNPGMDATAADRFVYGVKIQAVASRSLGSNEVTVYGLYVNTSNATHANNVYALYTDGGDNWFNADNFSYTRTHTFFTNGPTYLNYNNGSAASTEIHGSVTAFSGALIYNALRVEGAVSGTLDAVFDRNVSAGGSITSSLDMHVNRDAVITQHTTVGGTVASNTVTATTGTIAGDLNVSKNIYAVGAVTASVLDLSIIGGAGPLTVGLGTQARIFLGQQVLTGTGTYTPTAGTRAIRLRMVGGGGGGGGADNNPSAGSGGASGMYYEKWIESNQPITVGTGSNYGCGAGGTGGSNTGGHGTAGGSTFIWIGINGAAVSRYLCRGGNNGWGSAVGGNYARLGGGVLSAGVEGSPDFWSTDNGQAAFSYTGAYACAGAGGSSPFGAGGDGRDTTTSGVGAGYNAYGYGGGGGGACSNSTTGFAGGDGGAGLIIIEEYA